MFYSFLLQFARFRQLLKEVILLNDQLQKYTEKHLHLYAESCADESEDLSLLVSAKKCRLDDADASVLNESSQNSDCKQNSDCRQNEKRIVRIVPVTNQCNFVSSSAASESVAESSTMINHQESIKIQVIFGIFSV